MPNVSQLSKKTWCSVSKPKCFACRWNQLVQSVSFVPVLTYVPQAKESEWGALTASLDAAKAEATSLEAQNHRLGDEVDRLAAASGGSKSKPAKDAVSAKDLAAAVKA